MGATVSSRYAGMGGATASVAAKPQRDPLHAKSAPPQVMADALAHTFRSDQTVEPRLPSRYNASPGEHKPPRESNATGSLSAPGRKERAAGRSRQSDFHGERSNQTHAATTDPDALLARKGMAKRPSSATTAICWRRIAIT
jgi:hypothetical protein